jgi:hypothetical protein
MRRKTKQEMPKTTRVCDFPGCQEPGEYRAPKDRTLREHYWFCLKHVTEYNKNWDFLQGMSAEEIEDHIQHDTIWQRPTWKLGHGGVKHNPNVKDYFGAGEDIGLGMDGKYNPPPQAPRYEKKMAAAIAFMELSEPITAVQVKKQYKKLAKLYHPDMNKGDKEAELRFKKLNEAYHYIIERLGKK